MWVVSRASPVIVGGQRRRVGPAPKAELEWTQLDPASLSPDLRKAYDAYRDAARHANSLREAFERAMTNAIDLLS